MAFTSIGDIHVQVLAKGNERFVYVYDDAHLAEYLKTLGRHVLNPQLDFEWSDAWELIKRIEAESECTGK